MSLPATETVEYVANTRIGEKGQLTIPKQYRADLGLSTGDPIAVLRVGEALILIPEQRRFRSLCNSIAEVLKRHDLTAASLLKGLPAARERVFARRYPEIALRRKTR